MTNEILYNVNSDQTFLILKKRHSKPEPEIFCANPRHYCLFLEVHHPFYGTYSKGLTETLVDVLVHFFDIDRCKYSRSNPECRPFHHYRRDNGALKFWLRIYFLHYHVSAQLRLSILSSSGNLAVCH